MIFLSVGSSIGDEAKIFAAAEKFLHSRDVKVLAKSKICKTPPLAPPAKNIFSNAVWRVEFGGSAQKLLEILKQTEKFLGRDLSAPKWSDRVFDADILTFHDQIWNDPDLRVPHPELQNRIFVLRPWTEVAPPNFQIPNLGSLQTLLAKLEK